MTTSTTRRVINLDSPPRVPGLPFIGSALKLRYDPLAYFIDLYHRYGSVFQIKVLNRNITVLAGLEANKFLAGAANEIFTSEALFGGFAQELETQIFLVAMDGVSHRHLRKLMRRGYARSAIVPHLPRMIGIVDDFCNRWQPGERVAVFPIMQRLVTEQLGWIIANRPPGEYFPDLRLFLNTILNVKVLRIYPGFMLRSPFYKRAKQRMFQLAGEVLAEHRANPPEKTGRHANLIDDLLSACDENENPYPEDFLRAAVLGPYIAGIDTVASSISFLIYNILQHPDVYARIMQEVDAVFANGEPTTSDFRVMTTLNGAIQETLRMYPVAPFTPRTPTRDFEFEGYHIKAGTEVFFANAVTHYLPELYPEPHTFDVKRYQHGSKGAPGAFAPYTLDDHLCLGAGLAESQMMITTAALLRRLRLELESPDFQVHIQARPLPNPGTNFRVRVVGKR